MLFYKFKLVYLGCVFCNFEYQGSSSLNILVKLLTEKKYPNILLKIITRHFMIIVTMSEVKKNNRSRVSCISLNIT